MSAARLLFIHALSPVHAGTGQSIGAIDLAVARDRATQFPFLPGSSIKGSLRDVAPGRLRSELASDSELVKKLFGPETNNASDYAGALVVGDANLLLLPVRSVAGTFAWVTSPYLLHRFNRDLHASGLRLAIPSSAKLPTKEEECLVAPAAKVIVPGRKQVFFEDLDLVPTEDVSAATFAQELGQLLFANDPDAAFWIKSLGQRLCIVHDDVMTFLSEHATDVVARVALADDGSKTVRDGGLWYEESLPTESVMVGLLLAQPIKLKEAEVFKHAAKVAVGTVQLGGKATVGRGRCRMVLSPLAPPAAGGNS